MYTGALQGFSAACWERIKAYNALQRVKPSFPIRRCNNMSTRLQKTLELQLVLYFLTSQNHLNSTALRCSYRKNGQGPERWSVFGEECDLSIRRKQMVANLHFHCHGSGSVT